MGVGEEAARTPHIFLDQDEIRAEIERPSTQPINPIKDCSWLDNTWALLQHKKKTHGSCQLRELHVKIGEWERGMTDGYPAGWIVWERLYCRYLIATPSERDDRPEELNVWIRGVKVYSDVDFHEVRHIPEFVDF